jgi:cobalt-precorrin-5B (C1)-methyltransferase
MSELKRGYTTGVHASFAFKSALQSFINLKKTSYAKTFKMDNDDLDVTKGCEIVVSISSCKDDLEFNDTYHKPYILNSKNTNLEIYSGIGVGVVTKEGLKPPKNYPAINPKPLEVLKDIFFKYTANISLGTLYCTIGVSNGENIAKQTANEKVGVLKGISILGTTGFVKPISSSAYINSIEQELNFAQANGYETIVFTLGNTAFKKSEELTDDFYVIEIGNFIYDGISLAAKREFKNIELWLGIGKAVKVAQGFKNTHNRFGSIDFKEVQTWTNKDIKDSVTIKRVRELLQEDTSLFDDVVLQKTKDQLYDWFEKKIEVKIIW